LYSGPVAPKTPIDYSTSESDAHRLAQRQKQIDLGKNTRGYQRYCESVAKHQRTTSDPQTPRKDLKCSKRTFDALIKGWRRKLHVYDDPSQTSVADEDKPGELTADLLDFDLDFENMELPEGDSAADGADLSKFDIDLYDL
jgi:histone RNA hairpin-binding protein